MKETQVSLDLLTTWQPGVDVTLADRYRVIRKLGAGSMGSVWLAEDDKQDRHEVAIKVIPAILASNKRAVQQLKSEAKAALQLSHPHIVTLRALEETDEGPFLVMDYIQGQTLEDRLAERGVLPEDEVIQLFKPIAQALDYAHSRSMVNRDVKPSNIMIRDDGVPVITDFGITRELKEAMTRVTGQSTSGSLPYLSPEQLRGEAPAPAQDIYSLAATMYECLSGHPPFHRGQIEYQILNAEPPSLAPDLRLANLVMAGLAKDTAQRPAKAVQLLEDPAAGKKEVSTVTIRPVKLPAGFKAVGNEVDPSSRIPLTLEHELTGYRLRLVPAGGFLLGSPAGIGDIDEHPQRRIYLDSYWMGETQVTSKQYARFLNEKGNQTEGGVTWCQIDKKPPFMWQGSAGFRPHRGYEDYPVTMISWYGACAVARWMGGDLPTEAQWEKAAKGGQEGLWPWGDNWDPNLAATAERIAKVQEFKRYKEWRKWFELYQKQVLTEQDDFSNTTVPVRRYPANGYGLYDMAGNTWEWCQDWYAEGAYGKLRDGVRNPAGPPVGDMQTVEYWLGGRKKSKQEACRVVRGGGWVVPASLTRCAFRYRLLPAVRYSDFGVRVMVPC